MVSKSNFILFVHIVCFIDHSFLHFVTFLLRKECCSPIKHNLSELWGGGRCLNANLSRLLNEAFLFLCQYWIENPKHLINWASAIVVVYSVTSRKSFEDAERILQLIHETKPLEPGCTLLMGNKNDLRHLRHVTTKEGKRLSIHYGVRFSESSAAESYENVYNTIMKLLLEALVVENAKQHTASRRISFSSENIADDGGSPKSSIKQFMKDTFNSVVLSPRLSRRTVTF